MPILTRLYAVLLLFACFAMHAPPLYAQTSTTTLENKGTPYFPPAAPLESVESSATPAEPAPAVPTGRAANMELASCFDYYQFGSTPAFITADLSSAIAGAPLALSLRVENKTPYPVVDAAVYIKVLRYGHERGEKNVNGPDVVDFFRASDPVSIPAGGEANLKSIWQVPQDAVPGEYMMVTYVVSAERFNLLGLTFTDDIIGTAFNFQVVNDVQGTVAFDKSTATVLGEPFRFAAYPPRIPSASKEVSVGIDVVNTTSKPVTQEVTWTLYRWDALRADEVLDHKTEKITIPPGGRVNVAYTVTDTDHSVYYLAGSLRTAGGSSSLVGIRFVRGDVNEPRLNFVGATAYPAGEGGAAFACLHSTGTGPAENVKLELIAKKSSFLGIGGTIAKQTYEGPAAGEIRALLAPFTGVANSFTVTARLSQNGKLLEEVTTTYDCSDLTPDACPKQSMPLLPIGIGAAVILLAGAAFVLIRRRKAVPPVTPSI
jgi:hypothetical protein